MKAKTREQQERRIRMERQIEEDIGKRMLEFLGKDHALRVNELTQLREEGAITEAEALELRDLIDVEAKAIAEARKQKRVQGVLEG